jgi:hypothetical protein
MLLQVGKTAERFREAVNVLAEQKKIPVYQFRIRKEKTRSPTNSAVRRPVRDAIVFIGVAQEKTQAFHGRKANGQFQFDRDKTVYVNHDYFYIDDEEFGPLFVKICSYAPWSVKLCLNGHEWAKRQLDKRGIAGQWFPGVRRACPATGDLRCTGAERH